MSLISIISNRAFHFNFRKFHMKHYNYKYKAVNLMHLKPKL